CTDGTCLEGNSTQLFPLDPNQPCDAMRTGYLNDVMKLFGCGYPVDPSGGGEYLILNHDSGGFYVITSYDVDGSPVKTYAESSSLVFSPFYAVFRDVKFISCIDPSTGLQTGVMDIVVFCDSGHIAGPIGGEYIQPDDPPACPASDETGTGGGV